MTLRSATGEDWLFMLDTGSPQTVLDKSLEPKLGQRLETKTVAYGWLGKRTVGIYQSPKLYVGDTQLISGAKVWTDDLSQMVLSGHKVHGILGTDCLHHYCFQLDFASRKLRFLDPDHSGEQALGTAFPLHISRANITIHGTLLEAKDAEIGVDTAQYCDGALGTRLFLQAVNKQNDITIRQWRNGDRSQTRAARFREGAFDGQTYNDLILMQCPTGENFIGLRFLARHLVTFNFPKRTLYLKRISAGPFAAELKQGDRSGL